VPAVADRIGALLSACRLVYNLYSAPPSYT
jgi:hypothetical protein